MELRPGRVRQGHGRSWKRRAFTKHLREVGDVLFLRKVVPVWYPSIGARGRNTLLIARQTARRPGGLRHPRIATLGRFLRRNRWLGHPQLLAEAGSYWS